MPQRALKPCAHSGCPELTRERYCELHKAKARRASDSGRPSAARRGYDAEWRELRKMILSETPLCADPFGDHARAREVVVAEEVDHIVPVSSGGVNTRGNLQPLCKSCHSRKTRLEQKRTLRKSKVPVTIVVGPPGAGKTTLVHELARWGDLIVDVDALYQALSGLELYEKPDVLLPFVIAARDAVLERLSFDSGIRHAWVITTESDAVRLDGLKIILGANAVLVLRISANECKRRISLGKRRNARFQFALIDSWWRNWISSGGSIQ